MNTELLPVTFMLKSTDIRYLEALRRQHGLSGDELVSQLIGVAAAIAFPDSKLRRIAKGED